MGKPSSQQDSEPLYYEADGFVKAGTPVFHGFFGRQGGVSTDVYASLNCGMGSDDKPEAIKQNREIVAEIVGCARDRLINAYQVHGSKCVIVSKQEDIWNIQDKPKADAIVTDLKGLAISILTADCGPVLLQGQKQDGSSVIGAAHAGWGGALGGVLASAVEAMEKLGAKKDTIRAAIGPCIGQKSYEVSEDFSKPFLEEDDINEKFFMAGQREGHLMFDLAGYCALKLAKVGIKDVFIKDLDTYFNEEDFFSYRRTTHRSEKDYGRQISVIMIQE